MSILGSSHPTSSCIVTVIHPYLGSSTVLLTLLSACSLKVSGFELSPPSLDLSDDSCACVADGAAFALPEPGRSCPWAPDWSSGSGDWRPVFWADMFEVCFSVGVRSVLLVRNFDLQVRSCKEMKGEGKCWMAERSQDKLSKVRRLVKVDA